MVTQWVWWWKWLKIYEQATRIVWGACSAMVIVVKNGHGDPISNSGRTGLYFE